MEIRLPTRRAKAAFVTPSPLISAGAPSRFVSPLALRYRLPSTALSSAPLSMTARPSHPHNTDTSSDSSPLSRRAFTQSVLFSLLSATALSADAAHADAVTSQLTVYRDLPKGFTILRPSGWNEFEGLQDNYDIKWADVIQPLEFITVLTSPVDKDKQLADLGTPSSLGDRLATARLASLVSAEEKLIDGTLPAYIVELKKDETKTRQLTLLCISKQKLYSVNVSAPEKRWPKREKLMRTVVNSFKPKL